MNEPQSSDELRDLPKGIYDGFPQKVKVVKKPFRFEREERPHWVSNMEHDRHASPDPLEGYTGSLF